jgi:hypothetical protein
VDALRIAADPSRSKTRLMYGLDKEASDVISSVINEAKESNKDFQQ